MLLINNWFHFNHDVLFQSKKAEQVDFRKVLSPSKREDETKFRFEEQGVTIADIPRAKWKKEVDHTTVVTRRARHRNPATAEKKAPQDDDATAQTPKKKPFFTKQLRDMTVSAQFSCALI